MFLSCHQMPLQQPRKSQKTQSLNKNKKKSFLNFSNTHCHVVTKISSATDIHKVKVLKKMLYQLSQPRHKS